jgi:hypothetical protein
MMSILFEEWIQKGEVKLTQCCYCHVVDKRSKYFMFNAYILPFAENIRSVVHLIPVLPLESWDIVACLIGGIKDEESSGENNWHM